MHGADRGDREEFQREIAVGDGIDRVAGRLAEAERLGGHVAVDREPGAGKRCCADRAFVQVVDRVTHAGTVTAEHFDISHAVMAKGDRLGCLEMGEAGHDRVGMFFRAVEEGCDQVGQHLFGLGKFFLHPEAEIERDLVVARTGRVQAAGSGADQRRQPCLDVHVDVFELARELELSALDL
ncbi:hypothetical protein D3C73_894420 [compost metagenome]